MKSYLAVRVVALAAACAPESLGAKEPSIVTGLKQPESIAIGPQGRIYVSETGEYEVANHVVQVQLGDHIAECRHVQLVSGKGPAQGLAQRTGLTH
jgi:hypothetical protein